MEDFLQQIEKALKYNLYYIALQSTLSLPDICASLTSTARASKRKVSQEYIDWYDKYFIDKGYLSGADCYYFRCSDLHQGITMHNKSSFSRIMFLEPQTSHISIHNCIMNDSLCIDINIFCNNMIKSVRTWFLTVQNDTNFQYKYKNFIKRYPNGIPPYIIGTPVIS